MKQYRDRIADRTLQKKLNSKGAVLVEGAKWCGKTTTASRHAKSILYMQNPIEKRQNLMMAELNPSQLLEGDTPRLIDEWQLAPSLWDTVRFQVDQRDEFNQFILTGSAVPADMSKISHTGTGRIARMLMRPMSLYESGESSGEVSLKEVFQGNTDILGKNSIDIANLAFIICRGGWPKAIDCPDDIALAQALDYYDSVVNTDISRADNIERSPETAKRLLRSYARFIGSQAKITSIIADIIANDTEKISDVTISAYIQALKRIFIIEDSCAWNPNLRSKASIRTSDTRYYTDASIASASLGIDPQDLLNDLNTMGLFFENLCIRDLRIYADILDGQVYHYRDSNGLECDAVVHLRNGTYGLIEIKLGREEMIEEAASNLNRFADIIDTSRMKSPAFKMVLVGIGSYAYTRKDGVMIVPIGCLKD